LLLIIAVCIVLAGHNVSNVYADNTYTVTITIQGLPAGLGTNVYIDGNYNGTLNGGASATFTLSATNNPHAVVVDSYVQGNGNGTRYFSKDTIWGVSSPGNHDFTYIAQYLLTVQTAYSSATGQGWYSAGTSAHATVNDQQVDEGQGTRNTFNGWSGDATGTQLTSNGIMMSGPKVAIANWKTQFFLTIQSNPTNVTSLVGSGWYDAGTQANFSAVTSVPTTSNTRFKFSHWNGDYTGQQPTGSVLMDRPKTIKANYLAQYLLAVTFYPVSVAGSYNGTHGGWYDANSNVQLGPVPSIIDLSTVERLQFTGWSDNGSVSSNLSYTILMDSPRNVTLSYKTQYYVDVRSTYGTVSGSGWYDRGATATITAPTSSGTWPISYTLTGWTIDPPTEALTKTGDSSTLTVNGPYVVQAQWGVDYFPLILLFGGAVAFSVVGVGAVTVHKRGTFGRGRPILSPEKTRPSPSLLGGMTVCTSCGNDVPKGAEFCDKCRAPMAMITATSSDNKVYDYIVNHEGVISLSVASADLGISADRLKEITERLKREGRLA
jgi:hypothetical protein